MDERPLRKDAKAASVRSWFAQSVFPGRVLVKVEPFAVALDHGFCPVGTSGIYLLSTE
jgi:hypothetical protein